MNTVKLTLNGKKYTKTAPTVEDWLFNLSITDKIESKNVLADTSAAQATLEVVARYLKVSVEDIMAYGDLQEVMEAYNAIQKNLLLAFAKATEIWEKNVEAPAP